jgi:hypothetical protein
MVFSWFNTRAVDAFVDAEVADIARRVAPAKLEGDGPAARKAQDQLAKVHDVALRNAVAFVQREKPNLYQKARIANRMKWALREAGFPAAFVNDFAFALARVVAAANSQREI